MCGCVWGVRVCGCAGECVKRESGRAESTSRTGKAPAQEYARKSQPSSGVFSPLAYSLFFGKLRRVSGGRRFAPAFVPPSGSGVPILPGCCALSSPGCPAPCSRSTGVGCSVLPGRSLSSPEYPAPCGRSTGVGRSVLPGRSLTPPGRPAPVRQTRRSAGSLPPAHRYWRCGRRL